MAEITANTFKYAANISGILDLKGRIFDRHKHGKFLKGIDLSKIKTFQGCSRSEMEKIQSEIASEAASDEDPTVVTPVASNSSAASATGRDLLAEVDKYAKDAIDACIATRVTPEAMEIKKTLDNRLKRRHSGMTYEKAEQNVLEYRLDSSTIRFDEIVALIEDMYLRPCEFNSSASFAMYEYSQLSSTSF
jgi:hypothetical protein